MKQDNDWKSKYQKVINELDDKESEWKELENILRGAISRLSIAGRGIDDKLDENLRQIQSLSRKKQDQKLVEAVDQLSKIITSLEDGSQAAPVASGQAANETQNADPAVILLELLKNIQLEASQQLELKRVGEDLLKAVAKSESEADINRHIKQLSAVINQNVSTTTEKINTTEIVFQLIRLLSLDDSSQQQIDKQFASNESLTAQELQQIANIIKTQLSLPEDNGKPVDKVEDKKPGGPVEDSGTIRKDEYKTTSREAEDRKTIGDVISILLDRLSILPGANDPVQKIQQRVQDGIDDSQWPNTLNEVADIVSAALTKVNEEKRQLESFIANVTEQLGEITQVITEDHEDHLSGHRETLSLQSLMQKSMTSIEHKVSATEGVDQLKSEISKNIALIRGGLEDFVDRAKTRHDSTETRNKILSSQIMQMEKQTEQLEKKLSENRKKLLYDTLTGARSRLAYDEHMEQELARWKRYGSAFSYVILDIDHFKNVNDTYGHSAGDKALKIIAQLMLKQIRESDFLFRIGGEEFVLLLSNTGISSAEPLITKLREAVHEGSFHFKQEKIVLTLSAGLTESKGNDDVEAIYKRADAALYRAKNSGRNCQIVA